MCSLELLLETMAKHRDEPVFVLNETDLFERVQTIDAHFIPGFEGRVLAASIKANPNSRVLDIMKSAGIGGYTCATFPEIEKAITRVDPENIFFNHPVKPAGSIAKAASLGVKHFTVQHPNEIKKILETTEGFLDQKELEIVVRMQTTHAEKARINLSSKFGATPADTYEMLNFLKGETGVRVGLSMHVGSQNPDPEAFAHGITQLASAARAVGGVNIFNIGGGIPVSYSLHDEYSIASFFKKISHSIEKHLTSDSFWGDYRRVIAEPGRSLVAPSETLLIPVMHVEKRSGENVLYIEESVFGSFPDYKVHGWKYHFHSLGKGGRQLSADSVKYKIYGRSCDGGDDLGYTDLPNDIQAGDALFVTSAGAYMNFSSPFMSFKPVIRESYNVVEI